MSVTIITTVHKGDEYSDYYRQYQFYDCSVVPRVGEYFSIMTSRDEDGNYYEDGKPTKKFDGIVGKVGYYYEQRGSSSDTNRKVLFVDVELVDADTDS